MNKTTKALKLAEEALHAELESDTCEEFQDAAEKCHVALAAIREALADHIPDATKMVAEPVKQEPVAWGNLTDGCKDEHRFLTKDKAVAEKYHEQCYDLTELYAAPVDAKAIQHCPCCGSDYFAGKTKVDLDTAVKSDPLYLQGRADMKEEAAKECDGYGPPDYVSDLAAAIRGLK